MTHTDSADGRADESTGLQYPLGAPPEAGRAREVAPGVRWLRMPLPWALSHINLYALHEGGKAWAVVDSAAQTPEALEAWQRLLDAGGDLAGAEVSRVLVTHMHPDHVGMVGWLTRRNGCRLWMTRLEYLTCRTLLADTGREAPDEGVQFYRRAGWNDHALEGYRVRFGGFGKFVHALPDSFRRLSDGEVLTVGGQPWRVVVGSGHSPEHACFYNAEAKLLISGDQVLPRISSNVSVHPTEPDADPMSDWLASLARLKREIPDDVLVLPAHGEPFRGLHARLDRLASGQAKSLERLKRSLAEPKRVVDVFGALFARSIEGRGDLLHMATGEALANLNHLMARGEVRRELGEDGAYRYRLA